MIFKAEKAIFLQIADRLCDEILAGNYAADDRVPSVREYAVLLEVNTNTMVRAYEQLARDEVIYNKRGQGYFVAPDAPEAIRRRRLDTFRKETLPSLFREMQLLGLDINEVTRAWEQRKGQT